MKLSFSNLNQLFLFRFLNESIDLKGQQISLPEDEKIELAIINPGLVVGPNLNEA
jgi:hypothetical protein